MGRQKGTVAIESDKGWLRLRWRVAGKRYAYALGLPDNKTNRKIAEARANQIYLDVLSGNFDGTLVKYKPTGQTELEPEKPKTDSPTIADLFDRFVAHKAKEIDPRTLRRYHTITRQLKEFFRDRIVTELNASSAEEFQQFLIADGNAETVRRKIQLLKACWQWHELDAAIWESLPKLRTPPQEAPKPFTKEEVALILGGFKRDRYYSHYYPYVKFLLGTGVRIGEAQGLTWGRISDDCTVVEVFETWTDRQRKPPKNNKSRQFRVSQETAELLRSIRPNDPSPDSFVFLTLEGHPINEHNFRGRAWKEILDKVDVPYRKPYNCRATFTSHCLMSGMNPLLVAQLTGHDVAVLFEHYAAYIGSSPEIPDLF
ncbi:tyrosine-type recombinase/integrase [Tumidithrix elongata RA019]|uniref:Tyrosine-type recombinase/integrase n=1 Tax=Tumidithrix elongata BACA0141 TaxID=2716417 RepID=A0AAW9Q7X3_9CYAN|nr:tyrosine-type recombinase/integrase [Tumidithrix elongata RA019]